MSWALMTVTWEWLHWLYGRLSGNTTVHKSLESPNPDGPPIVPQSRGHTRHGAERHEKRGKLNASSDIQDSEVSLLNIPDGEVGISGGEFNGVGGNQFRVQVNVNGCHSQGSRKRTDISTACNEADLDTECNENVENEGPQASSSDWMRDSVPIQGVPEIRASRVVKQVGEEPYTIYFRCLATRKRGSPLWIPEPNKQLSVEYQRNGLVIGDIGIITDQGCFDSLFNISLPPDHPLAINTHDLPQNFSPLKIQPSHILKSSKFKKGASLSSGSVSVTINDTSGLTFESSASEGAILTLPDGSSSQDLRNQKILRDYLAVHLEEIYRCALIEHGREINNGDLRVVTGFDKTATWGMAAFSNSTSQRKPSFRLEFRPKNQGCVGQTHSWKSSGTAEVKAGPDMEEVDALRMGEPSQQDAEYKNQTVFVRTQTPTLNPTIWNALLEESGAGEPQLDDNSDTPSDSSSSPSGNSQSPGSGSSADEAGHKSATYRSKSDSLSSTNTLAMHPSNGINAMLLKLNPSAQMAITEDDMWISVLKDDDAVLPSTETLWGRILELYDAHLKDGVVFLTKLPAQAEVSPIHKEPAADAVGLSSLGRESNAILARETFDFKDKVVSAGAQYGSSSLEGTGHSSIFDSISRITQQIAAPTGVYVGPQSYNSQPSMGMSQHPEDIPRGPMGPNVNRTIKPLKPQYHDIPRGPIKSNVKGFSVPRIQTRSISGPPLHGGPAPNNYYPNPPGGYYPPPPPPGNYPPPAPQNSENPANYPYPSPPTSYGVYAHGSGVLPPSGGYHSPTGRYSPPTGVYYHPTSGYPHAPAGSYPPPAGSYPPPAGSYPPPAGSYPPPAGGYPPPAGGYPPPAGGYPPQLHAPTMSSNPTPKGGGALAIGGFVKRPRES